MVDCVSGPTTSAPDVARTPVQPPLAVQVAALLDDHDNVDVPPAAICAGLAEIETVGAGRAALTTTLAVRTIDPPGPVQTSV